MYSTDRTNIRQDGNKFVVEAWGGYDGYLSQTFDQVEDALDFASYLWGLNTSADVYKDTMMILGDRSRYTKNWIKSCYDRD